LDARRALRGVVPKEETALVAEDKERERRRDKQRNAAQSAA